MTEALGLVGGAGTLPALMAREARRAGWRVVAFALAASEPLDPHADRVVPCRLGDVGPILSVLGEEKIRHVVLAGRVRKDVLFQGAQLDAAAQQLLSQAADWSDDSLLETALQGLAAMGIEVLDQRTFLAPWLVPAGLVAGPPVPPALESDVARALQLARDMAERGVGQTVVLRAGSVAAVEAMEGTDEAIARAGRLGGPGTRVVKVAKPAQDMRFDVPVVGVATVAAMKAAGADGLSIDAARTLIVDGDAFIRAVDDAGIVVVGRERA
jgi:UDP-2,3-diacylglucosamine hydrolase